MWSLQPLEKEMATHFSILAWIDAEKSFDKIQHLFMKKNSPQSEHRGNLPKHNKGHIQQTHSKHHSQW